MRFMFGELQTRTFTVAQSSCIFTKVACYLVFHDETYVHISNYVSTQKGLFKVALSIGFL